MNILLVEDHPAVAQLTVDLLREVHGHDVRHAGTAADALLIARDFQADIVLIDLNLPDMSGYELVRLLRGQQRFERAVFVALTGFGSTVDARQATEAGFDAQFQKPMDFDLLTTLRPSGHVDVAGEARVHE